MKRFLQNVIFGRDTRINGLFALGFIASIALGCNCGRNFDLSNIGKNDNTTSNTSSDTPFSSDSSTLPSDSVIRAMVKETTSDFADAINSGDFSDIYKKSSTDFQSTYTEDQMKNVFKSFVEKKRVIKPILDKTASMTAEFSPAPSIRTEKGLNILVVNGKYRTKPVPVTFEYEYVNRGGEWKMLKLIVKLV